jgi:hypothetical protein
MSRRQRCGRRPDLSPSDVPGIEFIKADLSLMREAQRVAALLPAADLDLLVFTTGIMAGPRREETTEGIERDMAGPEPAGDRA